MKQCNHLSSAIFAQRERVLKRLQERAISTVEARRDLDIMSPAARVFDLRHCYGHNIQTHWEYDINPGGGKHRVAKYILMPGQYKKIGESNE